MVVLGFEAADAKVISVDTIQLVFNRHNLTAVVEFVDGKAFVARCRVERNRQDTLEAVFDVGPVVMPVSR